MSLLDAGGISIKDLFPNSFTYSTTCEARPSQLLHNNTALLDLYWSAYLHSDFILIIIAKLLEKATLNVRPTIVRHYRSDLTGPTTG